MPVAAELKVTGSPTATIWLSGSRVTTGGVSSLVIVSAGPAPFAPRMALLPYIRLGVLLGSVMLIGVNAVEALLAVRRYQARW